MQRIVIRSYETKKSLVQPVVFLVIGLILAINPKGIVEFLSYIFGAIFLMLGIYKYLSDLKRKNKTTSDDFYSILMCLMGLIFIFFSGTVEFLVRLILGVWLVVNGINTSIIGTSIIKINKQHILTLLIGFFLIAIGIYTIFVENLVFSSIGIIICVYSVLDIIDYFYIKGKTKDA